MNRRIKTSHIINANADRTWQHISKATGVNDWLPVISACRLEGYGEGSRSLKLNDLEKALLYPDKSLPYLGDSKE